MNSVSDRPRVLLVQRVMPHYRIPLFTALSAIPSFEMSFAFGARADVDVQDEGGANVQVPFPVIPLRNISLGQRETVSYQAGLMVSLAQRHYDVIIAEFNPRIISNVLACLRWHRRTRFIWWGHGIGADSGAAVARVRLLLTSLADAVIFYDRARANRMVSLGLPEAKVYVAPNSVDIDEIAKLRSKMDWEGRRDVIFIGRLFARKRVDKLLRAYAHAKTALPEDSRLVIVGDGPERAALAALASELGIHDAVQFVGAIHRQAQLAPYFNSSLASVCPGAVGLGAIHSLAFGVPMVVANDAGHGPEFTALKHEQTALVLETADVEQLAKAILWLARSKSEWTRMSETCTRLIDNEYGTAAMARVFEKAILATR